MHLEFSFKLINDDFSLEYALAHHNGKASENNPEFIWEDELEIKTEVDKIQEVKKGAYVLQGNYSNNTSFEFEIKNVLRIDVFSENTCCNQIAVSESILHRYEILEEHEKTRLHFYLKESEVFSNPIPGIYIDVKDFPKELKR